MTDETPTPEIVSSDTTAATNDAAAGVANTEATPIVNPAPASADYTVDIGALRAAHGDAATWAAHLADMLVHTTNTFIDPATFTPWFASYADEVRRAEARSIAFEIANLPIGEHIDGDSGALLLDLRNEMSLRARKRADIG